VEAKEEGYKGDMFYVSVDGHYIGDDGFVVPKDFGEFYSRFPNHIRNWVRKRVRTKSSEDDVNDWAQDLTKHLMFLPEESKHRESGKVDVIQTFDPFKQYGASQRRFLNYINFCLHNKFRTVGSKFGRNPLSCQANVSLSGGEFTEHDPAHLDATDEYVYKHSTRLVQGSQRDFKAQDDRMITKEFLAFVGEREPEVAPILHAVWESGGSFADTRKFWCSTCNRLSNTLEVQSGVHTGHQLGINQRQFNRFRGKVKELARLHKGVREILPPTNGKKFVQKAKVSPPAEEPQKQIPKAPSCDSSMVVYEALPDGPKVMKVVAQGIQDGATKVKFYVCFGERLHPCETLEEAKGKCSEILARGKEDHAMPMRGEYAHG
jgi:hypothetical protein